MADVPAELADRLRQLRDHWDGVSITQSHVARALGVSLALISSWESGKAIPPEERLKSYAQFFATRRSRSGNEARLVPLEDLSDEEERARRQLIDDLIDLREKALTGERTDAPAAGALGGRFWHFPGGQPVTIAYNTFESLGALDYSQPAHPNYIKQLANGDIDALLELVGHIRAENPGIVVTWQPLSTDVIGAAAGGHLVLLGGAAESSAEVPPDDPLAWLHRRLDLPVSTRLPDGGDPEFDAEFVVAVTKDGTPVFGARGTEIFRPIFLRDGNKEGSRRLLTEPDPLGRQFPQLEYDVALLARMPNPLNTGATVTICSGLFSRGSLGAVRALTDPRLRGRNEQFLFERFRDPGNRSTLRSFWMLFHVPVAQGETVTPDLNRPFHRLRSSS